MTFEVKQKVWGWLQNNRLSSSLCLPIPTKLHRTARLLARRRLPPHTSALHGGHHLLHRRRAPAPEARPQQLVSYTRGRHLKRALGVCLIAVHVQAGDGGFHAVRQVYKGIDQARAVADGDRWGARGRTQAQVAGGGVGACEECVRGGGGSGWGGLGGGWLDWGVVVFFAGWVRPATAASVSLPPSCKTRHSIHTLFPSLTCTDCCLQAGGGATARSERARGGAGCCCCGGTH